MRIMSYENQIKKIIQLCLNDMKVECDDEFDRNFERKAFFNEAWERRGGTYHDDKPLLVNTGRLRRSVSSSIVGNSLVYTSTEPYAGIHNEGGTIAVTKKMKSYFWYKYAQATGGFSKKKDDSMRDTKKNRELTTAAEFYKAMALMKVGRKIVIPRRQFVGWHPTLEASVRTIIEENLTEYFNSDQFLIEIKK